MSAQETTDAELNTDPQGRLQALVSAHDVTRAMEYAGMDVARSLLGIGVTRATVAAIFIAMANAR